MSCREEHDHILIRDGNVLVRVPKGCREMDLAEPPQLFDVRTGVQLREIHPPLQISEIERGYLVPEEFAAAMIRSGNPVWKDPETDPGKVVTMLEVKQRKLDSVVADSILDQLRAIHGVLHEFLQLADVVHKEERFWLSQQVLTLVRKFSGRELAELQDIVDWFKARPRKK